MQKKLLSLFLSALILLSCVSVGLIAFAEEAQPEETTAAVETTERLEELETVLETDETTTEATTAAASAAKDALRGIFSEKTLTAATDATKQAFAALEDLAGIAQAALADSSTAVGKFETRVMNLNGVLYQSSILSPAPADADIQEFQGILADYEALTDAQKAQVDMVVQNKFYNQVWENEMRLTNKDRTASAAKAAEVVKTVAQYLEPAAALKKVLDDRKLTTDEKLAAMKEQPMEVRVYAGLYSTSYGGYFGTKMISGSVAKTYMTLAKAYGDEALKENPFTEPQPDTPKTYPKWNKDFPEGTYSGQDDPKFQEEVWQPYLLKTLEKAEWDVRRQDYTAAFYIEGMEKVGAALPEFAEITNVLKQMLVAKDAFAEDTANLAQAKTAMAAFEKLSLYQQTVLTNDTTVAVRYITKAPTYATGAWGTTGLKFNDIVVEVDGISKYDNLTAFIGEVEKAAEPYNNTLIAHLRDAYNNVPDSLKNKIPEDILAKYLSIMACIAPDDVSFDPADLSAYKETVVTYPEEIDHEQVEKALGRIQNLLTDVLLPVLGVDSLTAAINNGLYTNATIAEIMKMIYPALWNLGDSIGASAINMFVNVSPKKMSDQLKEEKFAGAVAALTACGTGNNVENWDKLGTYEVKVDANGNPEVDREGKEVYVYDARITNGAFGFQDGDKEGFLDAFSAIFRPLGNLLELLVPFENVKDTEAGTYTYGVYEDLVPIFEMLDLRGVMSSEQYRAYVVAQHEVVIKEAKVDARIRPILVPIFNLIDDLGKEPLDTLLDVLPKLAYALDSGFLNDQVHVLISHLQKPLGIDVGAMLPEFTLNAEMIFDLVAPMLENLTIKEAGVNEETGEEIPAVTISIKLDKAKFLQMITDLAGCGSAVQKTSIARGTAYRMGIDSDKPDAFVVLFRWLYGEITTKDNMRAIKGVIDSTDLNSVVKMLIKTVLNRVAETPTDDALVALVNLAAPKAPEIKVPGEIGDLFPNKDKDNKDDGNKGDGTQQNGNPSIPKTGGSIMTICFSLAATAALAGGAMLAKKKSEEE